MPDWINHRSQFITGCIDRRRCRSTDSIYHLLDSSGMMFRIILHWTKWSRVALMQFGTVENHSTSIQSSSTCCSRCSIQLIILTVHPNSVSMSCFHYRLSIAGWSRPVSLIQIGFISLYHRSGLPTLWSTKDESDPLVTSWRYPWNQIPFHGTRSAAINHSLSTMHQWPCSFVGFVWVRLCRSYVGNMTYHW